MIPAISNPNPANCNFVLGLDGGGTKTAAIALSLDAPDAPLLPVGLAGPGNIAAVPVEEALENARLAAEATGVAANEVLSVCAGIAGASFVDRRAQYQDGASDALSLGARRSRPRLCDRFGSRDTGRTRHRRRGRDRIGRLWRELRAPQPHRRRVRLFDRRFGERLWCRPSVAGRRAESGGGSGRVYVAHRTDSRAAWLRRPGNDHRRRLRRRIGSAGDCGTVGHCRRCGGTRAMPSHRRF